MSEYDAADGILSYIIGETENILDYNGIWKQTFWNLCHHYLVIIQQQIMHTFRKIISEAERLSGWQPLYSLEMLKTRFNVSSEYQAVTLKP